MEKDLKGEMQNQKSIILHWFWEYETEAKQNEQDTQDGESLKQYQFTIYAIGEEMHES